MPDIPNIPMYQKIKDEILHMIDTNLMKPGDTIPTEQALMKLYGVSRITVSRALNELKNEGILERYPKRGTIVAQRAVHTPTINEVAVPPTKASAALSSQDSLIEVACILPSIGDFFSLNALNGVLSAFPDDKYLCHVFRSSTNPEVENYILRTCLNSNIAGIVMFPQDQLFFSNELLTLQLQKYPLVFIDRYLPRLDTSHVIVDNYTAGILCMKHLHELGHQRIAFVTLTSQNTFSVKHRIRGIQAAVAELNMINNSVRVIEHMDISQKISHYQEQFHKLVHEERITAFITSESATCNYLYNLFTSIGLKVPNNVSLMTFDKPFTDKENPEFFTYINQSEFLMGNEAGRILRKRIEGNDMNVYHKVITPSLVASRSTGAVVL